MGRTRRRLGLGLVLAAWGSLLALSLPPVGEALHQGLLRHAALPVEVPAAPDAGAVVALAGGRETAAPEYGGDTVSVRTLARARYAARLHRLTGLPILVSGGSVFGEAISEATLMKGVLEDELGVPVAWVEDRSRTTWENALYSAEVLARHGIRRVYLVTESSHMGRAVDAFRRNGLDPVPAPTRLPRDESGPSGWLPTAHALERSSEALHAYLGEAWYRLRHHTPLTPGETTRAGNGSP